MDRLSSLENKRTRLLSLYVMQNVHGLIKIGRSADPKNRKIQIQQLVGSWLERRLRAPGHAPEGVGDRDQNALDAARLPEPKRFRAAREKFARARWS